MKEQKKGDLFMETNIEKAKCIHHWVIGSIKNGESKGVCKKCNEKKIFNNVFVDTPFQSWKSKKAQNKKET